MKTAGWTMYLCLGFICTYFISTQLN